MAKSNSLTAQETLQLQALFENPERIEVHGEDRQWKGALIGSLLSAAALTFAPVTPAHAGMNGIFTGIMVGAAATAMTMGVNHAFQEARQAAHPATRPVVYQQPVQYIHANPQPVRYVEPATPGMGDIPQNQFALADLVRRDDLADIVATTPTLRSTPFPVMVSPSWGQAQVNAAVARASAQVAPAIGASGVRHDVLATQQPGGPQGVAYVSRRGDSAACLIVMYPGRADDAQMMARQSGLSIRQAMDFAVMRDGASCAQQAETKAAELDAWGGNLGRARTRIAFSGLVDARTQQVILSGQRPDPSLVSRESDEEVMANDRYADGFAMLAMTAQGRLGPSQWSGIEAWRSSSGAQQDTSSFLRYLRSELDSNPGAALAMRARGVSGFNAQSVAAFLKPRWAEFELKEMQAQQSRAGEQRVVSANRIGEGSTGEETDPGDSYIDRPRPQ
ncbi:MAG: hypothetical protein EPN79_11420 [Burkholderiaceae bacterium]|nr:MAG: hypothetical protein EPN79_11420 [Burkholderiaceae bacterium]TBR76705.1 MAG: hypothetical protein EPN64_05645 [Burkholderiaceae bacterium]